MDPKTSMRADMYTAPASHAFVGLAPLHIDPTGLDYLVAADEHGIDITYERPALRVDPMSEDFQVASFREAIGSWRWTASDGVTLGGFRTAIEAAVDGVIQNVGALPRVKVTEHRFVNHRFFASALKKAGEHVYEFRKLQIWCRTSTEDVCSDPGFISATEPSR